MPELLIRQIGSRCGSTALIWGNLMPTRFGISRGGVPHGIAPQFPVTGLENTTINYGRAFIPKQAGIPKGFVESHSISNYGWIFNSLTPDDQGYVKPK